MIVTLIVNNPVLCKEYDKTIKKSLNDMTFMYHDHPLLNYENFEDLADIFQQAPEEQHNFIYIDGRENQSAFVEVTINSFDTKEL